MKIKKRGKKMNYRYHKKVYYPDNSRIKLEGFTDKLNAKKWTYSRHTLSNLKYRAIDIKGVLTFIKCLKLEADTIFEYYSNNGIITKAVYRISYNDNMDLILVISDNKNIITIYNNIKEDKHFTLRKELYNRG